MTEHLSNLELDELAAGLESAPGRSAHAEQCEDCRRRLAGRRTQSESLMASVEARRVLSGLRGPDAREAPEARPAPKARRWLWGAPLVPVAVALAVVLWPEPPAPVRLKGAPTVALLDSSGRAVTQARVGERVRLAVGGAGLSRVVVLAVDERGEPARLWPLEAGEAAELPAGASVRLPADYEVTEGSSLSVLACFAARPFPVAAFEQVMKNEVARARERNESPRRAATPGEPCEAVARTELEVLR